jgi:hypothetical protein
MYEMHASVICTATYVPIEIVVDVVVRTLCMTTLPFLADHAPHSAPADSLHSREGRNTAPAPIAQLHASNARRFTTGALRKVMVKDRLISLMYPAQQVNGSNFGAVTILAGCTISTVRKSAAYVVLYAVERS